MLEGTCRPAQFAAQTKHQRFIGQGIERCIQIAGAQGKLACFGKGVQGALVVGVVGMLVGDIPTAYGLSPWISLVVGAAILFGILYALGKREDVPAEVPLEPAAASPKG